MADYGLLRAHSAAFMQLLYDEDRLTVYPEPNGGATTVPAGTTPPYVVVQFFADRTPEGGRMTHLSTRFRMRAYCQCVGANNIAAEIISDLVAEVVLDVKPVIAGRSVYPIRLDIGRDPLSSDTTGSTTVTITDVYRLESEPGVDS